MIALNGRYDGKVIVLDEPLDLPADQAVRITVEPIAAASKAHHPGTGKRLLGQQPGLVLFMAPDWDEPLPDDIWDFNKGDAERDISSAPERLSPGDEAGR
jgi:hypothetical protein